jgi:hypothetical protein
LVAPGGFDSHFLTSPFRIEQVLVVKAVVDGFGDSLNRKPIFFGNFHGREWRGAKRFAVKNFRPDSSIYE